MLHNVLGCRSCSTVELRLKTVIVITIIIIMIIIVIIIIEITIMLMDAKCLRYGWCIVRFISIVWEKFIWKIWSRYVFQWSSLRWYCKGELTSKHARCFCNNCSIILGDSRHLPKRFLNVTTRRMPGQVLYHKHTDGFLKVAGKSSFRAEVWKRQHREKQQEVPWRGSTTQPATRIPPRNSRPYDQGLLSIGFPS